MYCYAVCDDICAKNGAGVYIEECAYEKIIDGKRVISAGFSYESLEKVKSWCKFHFIDNGKLIAQTRYIMLPYYTDTSNLLAYSDDFATSYTMKISCKLLWPPADGKWGYCIELAF